jgi:5-methylcytosine-specific restriction endonuclease McrA
MAEAGARALRLAALGRRLAAEQQGLAEDIRHLLDQLVGLVRELDPVRRQTLWPSPLVHFIAQRQDWLCPACGNEIPTLNARAHHVDHVVPWSLGGGNEPANIQILHAACNLAKGARCEPDDLIRYLQGRLMNLPG